MKSVIKSLLTETDDTKLLLLQPLLQEDLLSSQEKEYVLYIQDTYSNTNLVPTEEYFLNKFPEYSNALSKSEVLSVNDLKIHINQLYNKRSNLNLSKKIMEIANRVSKEGLSDDDLEILRNLQSSTVEDTLDEDTYNFNSYKEKYEIAKTLPAGLLTGIKAIDDLIGGLTLGTVNLISAFVASFKSVTGLNIAYYNTYHLGYNVAVISLEVPRQDMMHNLLCRHSVEPQFSKYAFIPHDKIRKQQLSEEEEDYLLNTVLPDFQTNSKGKLFLLDESDFKTFSFSEIRAKLEKIDDICREQTGSGLDAVIVDHMHLTKFSGSYKGLSDGQVINMYTSFFRKLSIHFRTVDGVKQQLCAILLCQVNRDGWSRASKHGGSYSLTALSEANELERAAYRAIFLYTNDSMKEAKEMSVQLLKNRAGQCLPEPTVVYADGESYTVGDVAEGFDTVLTTDDIADLFSDSSFSIF